MANVTLDIPDDVLAKFKSGVEAGNALRLAAAFSLCRQGELSTSQAGLAGLAYADFLEAAAQAKFELFPVNLEELKEEASIGHTLGHRCVADDLAGSGRAT